MKDATEQTRVSDPPDLAAGDREPINTPGHIQPHGVLIATAPGTSRISHLSANLEDAVGLPAAGFIDGELNELLGSEAFAVIKASLGIADYAPTNLLKLELPFPIRPQRKVLAHRWQDRIFVELEDAPARDCLATLYETQNILASLHRAQSVAQLCDEAATQVRHLTGYDRVMIYRFNAEGQGTVVAEAKAEHLTPYLDLRYPASDITPQGRRLYALQRVQAIPDRDYTPVRLLSADSASLDLTYSSLRGILPMHREHMRNMGVRAGLSISLLRDGALWGMIVCHHMTTLVPSAKLRALCDLFGQMVSMLLQRAAETEALAARLTRSGMIAILRDQVAAAQGLVDGLSHESPTLLQLMGAGGALIRFSGETRVVGKTPPFVEANALVDALLPLQGNSIVALSDAGMPGGIAERFPDTASGVLLMPMEHHPGDAVVWFRSEEPRKVTWCSDLSKPHPEGARLFPSHSFAAWTELQRGRSVPWTAADVQTAEDLRQAITGALLHQAERQLAHLSAYDSLTGMANRRTVEARLKRWSLDGAPPCAALLFIDLDRFKAINDTLGHQVGDECLIEVAARLLRLAPPGSLAGRLGGDEFVLFWPCAERPAAQALGDALVLEFARPFLLNGHGYYVGASVGIACETVTGAAHIMRDADVAMYAAKREGGGRAILFHPGHHDAALSHFHIEQDLHRAIENRQFEVYYQPLVGVVDLRIRGFEALLRWHHPDRGWVSPADFIPLAEQAGLIAKFGAWVLTEVVQRAAEWRKIQPALTIGANVSARQLTDGALVHLLSELLSAADLTPQALWLEVTETVLMDQVAVHQLDLLRSLGIGIAVDDFGSGYSSFSYLQRLPVDTVKIDRSFVAPLGSSAKSDRLFTAIVDMARTLNMRTVAEGCETWEQWRTLQSAGCDSMQGWLAAPALDAASAERLLRSPPQVSRPPAIIRSLTKDLWRTTDADRPDFPGRMIIQKDCLLGGDIFFAAVQLSRIPMTVVDPRQPEMPLVFANRAFEVMTGYDMSQILGRNCRFLQGPETDPAAIRQIHEALALLQPVAVELINYRADRSTFLNALHISPVFDESGQLAYFFGSQLDISRRRWT